ncbi:MAG TPA: phosphate ABC transporter permease PstA [Chloroflexota bacterium]|nr:phosphate ABC transporter permease PstA [Chloroflexota bacterium]HZU06235.1 phosphate ABC transporter permease PstA [Chloroflexota bacterium]
MARRRAIGRAFELLCLAATSVGILVLIVLLVDIARRGLPTLTWDFLTNYPSRFPEQAGIRAALVGSLWLVGLTALFAVPTGIAAGVWLEEYARRGWLSRVIEVNIANLAGVPSIIYGLLGLGVFVRALQFDRSVLSGALTMALLVLPIIIINTREALRAVPGSLRDAAYALGATRSQVVWGVVLPAALPGVLTGIILALSRAIGETAPLITIGALTFIAFLPRSPLDPFTVLPIQIFNWVSRPQPAFHQLAASGIIVLLLVLLSLNALAIYLRDRARRSMQW